MLLLRALGRLRLEGDPPPRLLSPRKELVLLVYAARRAPRPVRRAELASLLWESREPERARQSLRQALLDLRRLVPGALEETGDTVRFRAEALRFDVAEFEGALDRGDPAAALALWDGEFLAGIESTAGEELRVWIEAEREWLRHGLRLALEGLIGEARRRAAWAEATSWSERWVELFPLDERGHYHLAEVLLLAGRPADARIRYERGRAALRSDCGVEPSIAFLQLGARIERAALRAAPRDTAAAALPVPDLVGRGPALGGLESAWRAILQGGAATVLLEGEPGVGKSRLAEAFVRRLVAGEPAPVVVAVRLAPSDRDIPLAAVTAIALGLADAPGLGGAPAHSLAELARLAPGLGVRFPHLPPASGTGGALIGALLEAVGAVAAERPVVLVLDDVAHADEASVPALRALLRGLPPNVLALATARTGVGPPAPGQLAMAGAHALRRLTLQRLDADGVRALLGSMLQLPAGEEEVLAARLHAAAAGNPHLTVELVAALAGSGALRPVESGGWRLTAGLDEPLPVPGVVREAVEQRLAALGPEARALVDAAAVLDGRIETDAAAAVAGLSPAGVVAALDELRSAGLVHPVGAGGDAAHELVPALAGRVAYDRLASARRDALHRAAADHYAGLAGGHPGARTAAAHHWRRARRTSDSSGRRRWAPARIAALLLLSAAALMTGGTDAPPARAALPRIAVMPFVVGGGPDAAGLGRRMAQLLTDAMDGGAVRAFPGGGRATADVGRAAEEAAKAGATEVLVGRIVEGAGGVRAAVELYAVGGRPERIAQADAEGAVAALADELARALLVRPGRPGADRLGEVAAAATPSLPALRAFLEGRRHLRAVRVDSAASAFRRAVEADSGFGLAWYGLGRSLAWSARDEEALAAALRAEAHSGPLPRQERLVLQGFRAHMAGLPAQAESAYRAAIDLDTHHLEAWYNLGEVLYHHHWALGRPIGPSWAALGAALERDPDYGPAAVHMAQLAALEGRRAALDTLVSRLHTISPQAVRQHRLDVLRAFVSGKPDERRSIAAGLRDTLPYVAWAAVWTVGLFARDLDGASALAAVWAGNRGDFGVAYRLLRADLALARGRWEDAGAELKRAAAVRPGWELEHRALLAISPALAPPAGELAALRDELRAWDPAIERPSVYPHQSIQVPQRIRPLSRLMLLGLLSGVLGDQAAADAWASEAERLGNGEHGRLARSIAREIRARAALERGDAAAALAWLEVDTIAFQDDQVRFSPVYARISERFTRAEALRLAGRLEEALAWYESLVSQNLHELVYLAPAERRRAEVYRSLGRSAQAERSRRAAEALWTAADPALLSAGARTRTRTGAPAPRSGPPRAAGAAAAPAARRDRSARAGRSRPAGRTPRR